MLYSGETVFLKSTDNAKANVLCKQVNKITAKKLYEKGVKVWLHPCNLTLNNVWQVPYHFQKAKQILNVLIALLILSDIITVIVKEVKELFSLPNVIIKENYFILKN